MGVEQAVGVLGRGDACRRPDAMTFDMQPEIAAGLGVMQIFYGDRKRQERIVARLDVPMEVRGDAREDASLVGEREIKPADLLGRRDPEASVMTDEFPKRVLMM